MNEHVTATDPQDEADEGQEPITTVEADGAELNSGGPIWGATGEMTPELRSTLQAQLQDHSHALIAAACAPFAPPDRNIVRSTAAKYTEAELQERLAYARLRAASPAATPLTKHMVKYWLAILATKFNDRGGIAPPKQRSND